jgi:serine/threonine-protein kinase HipA
LPSNSGQGFQEFICGDDLNDSTLANAMTQTQAFGLTRAQAAQLVAEVIGVVKTWRGHFAALGVSEVDLESLAQRIDGDELKFSESYSTRRTTSRRERGLPAEVRSSKSANRAHRWTEKRACATLI